MPVTKMTPTIGLTGRYTGRVPFTTLLVATNTYQCIAIRKFSDIVIDGEDVFTTYYEPHELDQATYAEHEVEGVNIITLLRNDGEVVFIPDAYIESFPLMQDVLYQRVSLLLDMGVLPGYVDYTLLKDKILNIVREIVNPPSPNIYISTAPTDGGISMGDHETLEATRTSGIVAQMTDYAERLRLEQLTNDQAILIEDLSNKLLAYSTDL